MEEIELENMNKEELKSLLNEKEDLYKEVKEEMIFVLGQTGRHISGHTREEYKEELKEIQSQIDQIKAKMEKDS